MLPRGVLLLIALAFIVDAIKITSPDISINSQSLETHIIFKRDSSLAADGLVISDVKLTGTGAPTSVKPEEVVSANGGTIQFAAEDGVPTSGNEISGASLKVPSLFMLVGFIGMLFGNRYSNIPLSVFCLIFLFGSALALTKLDPSWVLTVTVSVPSNYKLNSLNIKINSGSIVSSSDLKLTVSKANIDLSAKPGNKLVLYGITFTGNSTVIASDFVKLDSTSISNSAVLTANSTQGSAHVYIQGSYGGSFRLFSELGYALSDLCSSAKYTNSSTKYIAGHCGSTQFGVIANAKYDSVIAAAEDTTSVLSIAKRWSDAATWGGKVPANGDKVVINSNQIIMMDSTTAALGSLEVRGTLIADPEKDFWVTSDSITVIGGTIRIGWISSPFTKNARFTLTGKRSVYTSRAPYGGFSNDGISRGFRVFPNSNIQMHGNVPKTVYTRLNDHAKTNDTVLTVDSVSGWAVGDEIAISPTTWPSTSRTDYRVIAAVDPVKYQITINKGLSYARFGKIQYATDAGMSFTQGEFTKQRANSETPSILDERAVIAHLSRNIVIESPNDTEWQNGHGVHFMWMGNNTVQLNGIQVRRGGQAGAIGRYAIHAHMQSYNMPSGWSWPALSDGVYTGDATNTYVRNIAVYDSVNRGIVIHGTCGARYVNNIAVNVIGHSVFFEDGSEIRNHFIGNVILGVNKPNDTNKILLTDDSPAGVWFSNPNNHFRDNLVGDSVGFGVWNSLSFRFENPNYADIKKPDSVTFTVNKAGSYDNPQYEYYAPIPKESWVLTAINSTAWSVVGDISGAQPNAIVDQNFMNIISFKISGSAPVGSQITFWIDSNAGCLGQSKYVNLWPSYTPVADYSNNTFFSNGAPGMTDGHVVDDFGNQRSWSFATYADARPNNDYGKMVPTHFDNHHMWMNQGGYGSRINNPLYTRWVMADNGGTDISGAVQRGLIKDLLFVGNSLNTLEPQLYTRARHALASYHFQIAMYNLTFFNYPPLPPGVWETARFLAEVPGLLETWDLYLNSIEFFGPKENLKGWKLFNVTQMERVPPPNVQALAWPGNYSGADGPYGFRRYWTHSAALYDNEGSLGGKKGEYLIFDVPFLTYNLTNVRRVGRNISMTMGTTDRHAGFAMKGYDDNMTPWTSPLNGIDYLRLDENFNKVGNWSLPNGENSWLLGFCRHTGVVNGGIYRLNHQDGEVWKKALVFQVVGFSAGDHFIMGFSWSGSVVGTDNFWYDWGKPNITVANSRNEMVATLNSIWQDTANNQIWYHHLALREQSTMAILAPGLACWGNADSCKIVNV